MPRKLLLADDSVTIQRVIELTFADEDIQVIAVGDGQQAIARIDADRPDVVLADIGMPERDGYEVAAHVKENPQTAHIPVLLLTGAFEPIDEARARAVGCDGVLVKPFEPQMVINRVKDLLAGRRPESLWSMPPGPTGAVIAPHAGPAGHAGIGRGFGSPRPEAPASRTNEPASRDSLDEYFDRLDAAFSEAEPVSPPGMPPPAPKPPAVTSTPDHESEFGSWDIPFEPARPAAGHSVVVPPAPSQPEPPVHPPVETPVPVARAANETPTIAPEMSPAAQAPELADAFAALLAAEQQFASSGAAPAGAAGAGSGGAVDEAAIEEVVRRVLARMTEDTVRGIVLDVAERLVRAEIDRIKQQAKL